MSTSAIVSSIRGHQYFRESISRSLSRPQCPSCSCSTYTNNLRFAGAGTILNRFPVADLRYRSYPSTFSVAAALMMRFVSAWSNYSLSSPVDKYFSNSLSKYGSLLFYAATDWSHSGHNHEIGFYSLYWSPKHVAWKARSHRSHRIPSSSTFSHT